MTRFLFRRKSNMPALSSGPFIRALYLAALLLVALASGCDAVQERISGATSTPPPPSATTPATPPQSTTPPSPRREATSTSTSGLVLPVSIAGETADLPDYDRGDWRHWTDEDRDCQNARQEVLIAESATAVTFQSDDECRVATGQWTGPYTGQAVADPGSLDVDHMVPLANAHRSGAWAWDRERKREFANYLGYDNHLIATTSSANRAKGAKGPEEWRPPLEDYWCVYAVDWVTIKNEWGLTVTEAEYAALSEMLGTCETTTLLQPRQGTAPVLPTSTTRPACRQTSATIPSARTATAGTSTVTKRLWRFSWRQAGRIQTGTSWTRMATASPARHCRAAPQPSRPSALETAPRPELYPQQRALPTKTQSIVRAPDLPGATVGCQAATQLNQTANNFPHPPPLWMTSRPQPPPLPQNQPS